MHELGLIIDVVEKVDRIAEEQNLKKIDKVESCVQAFHTGDPAGRLRTGD